MKNIFLQIPGFKEFYLYFKKSIIYYLAKKKWNKLKKSGFEKVMLRDFEKDLDLEERHFESIYAVAIK